MAEREGTPEEFAKLAAAARSGSPDVRKRQEHERIMGAFHPDEPDPEIVDDVVEEQEFIERLFGEKPGHAELVRLLYRDESEEE